MLNNLNTLEIRRVIAGTNDPISGVLYPLVGCIPLATMITGVTASTIMSKQNQLSLSGTVSEAHKEFLLSGNYVFHPTAGEVRKIKDVNSNYSMIYVEYPFATPLSGTQLHIAKKSIYKIVEFNNIGGGVAKVQEVNMSSGEARSLSNIAGIECISYNATGTTLEINIAQ